MTHTLKVPHWAADITDDGMLSMIAFHSHVNRTYGPNEWYNYSSRDVNTILGISLSQHQKWMANKFPSLVDWVEWANLKGGEVMLKMDGYSNGDAPSGYYTEVEISDERCIRVWCYLLGCMNRHLVTPDSPSKKSGFLAGTYGYLQDTQLFKYSHTS